jgi:hypothetical protein
MVKFRLGSIVGTPAALAAIERAGVVPATYIVRHARGDWGDIGPEDIKENELSLDKYLRLMSAYVLPDGTRIWIITEADRSATTILLPEDY